MNLSFSKNAPAHNTHFRGFPLVLVLTSMSILLIREIGNPSLGYPDADRILMDGVFILDFLRDLPLDRVYAYTTEYFGQYPALSIGYRPPFFPFIEALFNGAFGINMWSSRLAILAFALIGVSAWYLLVQRIYDTATAFGATMLLVTTPFVAKWGWYTMAELPVLSLAMVTGYCFYRFAESQSVRWLYITAILFSLTVWTKQTAVYLALWFLAYMVVTGTFVKSFRSKHIYIAIFLMLLALIPLAVIMIWLGDMNLRQSIGTGRTNYLSWDNLQIRLLNLYKHHLTLPVLVLSVSGITWSVLKRDRRAFFFGLLIVFTYGFFTYLDFKNPRHPIFWIPAFTAFAAIPTVYLRERRVYRNLFLSVVLLICGYQIKVIYERPVNYATGYQEAANYILERSVSPTVFFDGYNNGYFTYFMRALDPNRSMYVLRGDKLLSSSAISSTRWLEVHIHNEQGIKEIFDDYGIDYVVVESIDRSGVEIHQVLRDYLKTGPFTLENDIQVESTRPPLRGQQLLIYRYTDRKPIRNSSMKLRLPVVGKTIDVQIRKLSRHEGTE
jgi:hypothetical protein